MHGSAQSSYKNKNVLKILPSGFVFLLEPAFNLNAFKFFSRLTHFPADSEYLEFRSLLQETTVM